MICWGDPHFPSPTHYGGRNLGTTLSFSSSSSSRTGCDGDQDYSGQDSNLRNFTLTELEAATQNFHSESLLEEGNSGKIYKASFADRETPSVGSRKAIVFISSREYHHNHESQIGWQTKVGNLGRLYHPNIVSLLGFCYDEGHDQVLHVYDFAAKSSLSIRLFGGSSPLPWETRLKIAIGAARGLAFLHARKIIYRDVTSSNFLLDESYAVKLSDFGLAMFGPPDGESRLSVPIMGTRGYASPEYVATDVSEERCLRFWVVLLEILTGSRAIDTNNPNGEKILVEWAGSCLSSERKLMTVVDSNANYPSKVSMSIAQLISKCILPHPHNRPSMHQVVEALEAIEVSTSSLSNRLFDGSSPLPWETRLKIAIGAARGLAFLHARKIIYRDVTSSNFLLDESYAVKLSDFGLAMLGPPDGESRLSVPIMGTLGYASPEYVATGKMYLKSDVYGFGVVLLEILTGSRAIDTNNPNGEKILVEWAGSCLSSERKLMTVVDSNANYPSKVSMSIAQLISKCILPHPHNRPSMHQVVEALEAIEVSTSSLNNRLFDGSSPLPWETRLKIAIGAARGLAFLHARKIIYRDVTSSNFLLDESYAVKLSDFGLAMLGPPDGESRLSVPIMGTRGYASPEYVATGKIYLKSDVYSFGVVLLEILTGSRAIDMNNPNGKQILVEWAGPCLSSERKLMTIVDSKANYPLKVSMPIVQLISKCILPHPHNRPSMHQVVEALEAIEVSTSSLSNRLFDGSSPLPWEARLKIAIGAARGLTFLHARKIIYRDVTSSNFLLDESYAVKLSDFGLSMFGPPDGESHLSVPIMGTCGYASPEYVATGNIYLKSDVYGFGVVLLEILTGSRAIDTNNPNGKRNLVKWAGPCLTSKRKVMKIVDSKANYPLKVSVPIAQLISKCILPHPQNRPSMPQVIEALEAIEASTKTSS